MRSKLFCGLCVGLILASLVFFSATWTKAQSQYEGDYDADWQSYEDENAVASTYEYMGEKSDSVATEANELAYGSEYRDYENSQLATDYGEDNAYNGVSADYDQAYQKADYDQAYQKADYDQAYQHYEYDETSVA